MLFRIGRVPELQSEIAAGRTQIFAELAALAIIITHPFGQLLQIAVRNRHNVISMSFESRTVQKGDVELRIRIILEFSSEEDESTTSSPLHLLLTQALEMLSDREKDILLTYLMYEDGTKYLPGTVLQELCTRHGITADNARQIKSRAMKKLRQQIQLLEMDK